MAVGLAQEGVESVEPSSMILSSMSGMEAHYGASQVYPYQISSLRSPIEQAGGLLGEGGKMCSSLRKPPTWRCTFSTAAPVLDRIGSLGCVLLYHPETNTSRYMLQPVCHGVLPQNEGHTFPTQLRVQSYTVPEWQGWPTCTISNAALGRLESSHSKGTFTCK